MSLLSFLKKHKAATVLLIIIAYIVYNIWYTTYGIPLYQFTIPRTEPGSYDISAPMSPLSKSPPFGYYPQTSQDNTNRIVIKESNLSLLIEDVRKTGDQIIQYTKTIGGYMVFTSYERPSESPFATITVRVPTHKLDEALAYFRSLAIKVTSESLVGSDVTEEYTDIEARLATLRTTKAKFEEILEKATNVQDILTVQREIINLQQQIDSLIGQKQAIEQNAKLTKITLYLSTDELALPYAPDKAFRPGVVLKQAVRSLLNSVRVGAEALIWIVVYTPIWGTVLIAYLTYKRWKKKKQPTSPQSA